MFKTGFIAILMVLSFALRAQEREKVLVVCAHPDDSIAVAGTLFLMKDRFEIHVADLTKGQSRDLRALGHDGPQAKERMAEESAAAAMIGAKVHWLGFKDGALYATPEACDAVADLVKEIRPRVIFSMWPIDRHQDHSMAGTITLKGAMLAGFTGEFYYYEEVYGSKGFMPVHYVDVTSVAEQKRKYIECYVSQNKGDHLSRVEMHGAKARGYQALYKRSRPYAECFMPLPAFHMQGRRCIFTEIPEAPRK